MRHKQPPEEIGYVDNHGRWGCNKSYPDCDRDIQGNYLMSDTEYVDIDYFKRKCKKDCVQLETCKKILQLLQSGKKKDALDVLSQSEL